LPRTCEVTLGSTVTTPSRGGGWAFDLAAGCVRELLDLRGCQAGPGTGTSV